MNILIIEDEQHTAERLVQLLKKYDQNLNILAIIPSIKKAKEWFRNNKQPDLIFQDIVLNDGNCFEIYEEISIDSPFIFTTAYSEYALESFKLNSIDYIVKPYDFSDLKRVLEKFEKFKGVFTPPTNEILKEVLKDKKIVPKKRFLIKTGDNFTYLNASDIQYFMYENGLVYAYTINNKKSPIDNTISELGHSLDSSIFFQINRKQILNINSIKKISTWFTSRLIVRLNIETKEEIIVSRERVKAFKEWLGQ